MNIPIRHPDMPAPRVFVPRQAPRELVAECLRLAAIKRARKAEKLRKELRHG